MNQELQVNTDNTFNFGYAALSKIYHQLDKKYSVGKILESLANCNCYPVENNIYMFSFLNDVGAVVDKSLKTSAITEIKAYFYHFFLLK